MLLSPRVCDQGCHSALGDLDPVDYSPVFLFPGKSGFLPSGSLVYGASGSGLLPQLNSVLLFFFIFHGGLSLLCDAPYMNLSLFFSHEFSLTF